jgi:hypothetical protein
MDKSIPDRGYFGEQVNVFSLLTNWATDVAVHPLQHRLQQEERMRALLKVLLPFDILSPWYPSLRYMSIGNSV